MSFDLSDGRPVQCARHSKDDDSCNSSERLLYVRTRSHHQYSAISTKAAMTVLAVGNISLLLNYIVDGSGKFLIVNTKVMVATVAVLFIGDSGILYLCEL